MIQTLNGSTRVLAIIGYPVRHSLSPIMQNAALSACGQNFVYVPFEVAPDSLSEAVAGLKAIGVAGLNVTIPHKFDIMKYLDRLDETAIVAGAVNTVNNEAGQLVGYNTDGDGLIRSLAADLDFIPYDRTILMIGAGGAARGALAALCRAGARKVMILNRTCCKAAGLVSAMKDHYPGTELIVLDGTTPLDVSLSGIDLVLNATSLGMKGEIIPVLCLGSQSRSVKVYDMVYAPPVTPLLSDAAKLGLSSANGLGMLVAQGELAFRIWTGIVPPSGLMKRALAGICNN